MRPAIRKVICATPLALVVAAWLVMDGMPGTSRGQDRAGAKSDGRAGEGNKPARRSRRRREARFPTAAAPTWDEEVLELFFSDAREKLGPGEPGSAVEVEEAGSTSDSADGEDGEPATASGFAWSGLISAATIEDTIKGLVATSAEATRSPSAFKGGGNKQARENYSIAAMLFGVIAQYDGDVRWKRDAAGLKALYGRAAANCKVGTDNSYKEAKLRSDDLAQLVSGGKVEAPEAGEETTWADVVDRPPLMLRMGVEGYSQRLKSWTADQGEFAGNRDEIVKEAELLAVIAWVIQDPSFEFADDETYAGYARELGVQAREMVEAVKADSLPRAQKAAGQLNQACSSCHEGFRSG